MLSEKWKFKDQMKSHAHQELFLCLLRSCGTHGHKLCWLSELGVLGTHPRGLLKSWGTRCGSKPFTHQAEAGSWGLPPNCMALGWERFMVRVHPSLSYSFWGIMYLVCRSHWASFWIFLRGNCSVCGCTFCVSKGGRKFRSLLSLSLSLFIIRTFFNYRKMQGNTQKLMGTCQKKQEPAWKGWCWPNSRQFKDQN